MSDLLDDLLRILSADGIAPPGTHHLARRLGVSPRTVQRWRDGSRRPTYRQEHRVLTLLRQGSCSKTE